MVAHTFNPSTWEAEASRSLWVQGQLAQCNKFHDSQGYKEKSCLEILKRVHCLYSSYYGLQYLTWWNCREKLSKPHKCWHMNEADSPQKRENNLFEGQQQFFSVTWPSPCAKTLLNWQCTSKLGHRNHRYQSLWQRTSQLMISPPNYFPSKLLMETLKKSTTPTKKSQAVISCKMCMFLGKGVQA